MQQSYGFYELVQYTKYTASAVIFGQAVWPCLLITETSVSKLLAGITGHVGCGEQRDLNNNGQYLRHKGQESPYL